MKKKLFILGLLGLVFASCEKEPQSDPQPTEAHAYVLNEGSWQHNNASLSLLDPQTGNISNDYFAQQNGRGLGDVAQDAVAYGGKLYVTVSESHTLEVINLANGKSIKTHSFGSTSPRYMVCEGGNLYVTAYDKKVYRFDTASLELTGTCTLAGALQPEGIAAAGGKLYVCSSWESDASWNYTFDNKVMVIDAASFTLVQTLTVNENPQRILALGDGRLVVSCGNDYNQPVTTVILNPANGQVQDLNVKSSGFDTYGNQLYLYFSYTDYPAPDYLPVSSYHFKRVDLTSMTVSDITFGGVTFVSPYGLNINPLTGDVYITDSQNFAANGDVHCFSADGLHKWSAECQSGPSKVVFF